MDSKAGLLLLLSCIILLSGPQVFMVEGLDCDICVGGTGLPTKCVTKPCNSLEDLLSATKELDGLSQTPLLGRAGQTEVTEDKPSGDQLKLICAKAVATKGSTRAVASSCGKLNPGMSPQSKPYKDSENGFKLDIYICDEKNAAQCKGNAYIAVRPVGVGILITFSCFLVKLMSSTY